MEKERERGRKTDRIDGERKIKRKDGGRKDGKKNVEKEKGEKEKMKKGKMEGERYIRKIEIEIRTERERDTYRQR
jgi:hypothetical protein